MKDTKGSNRPNCPNRLGGQHRVPQGISTFDDETDQERRERLRRANAELDALEHFNAELQAAINAEFGSQPF